MARDVLLWRQVATTQTFNLKSWHVTSFHDVSTSKELAHANPGKQRRIALIFSVPVDIGDTAAIREPITCKEVCDAYIMI